MNENLKRIQNWNDKNPIGTKVRVTNAGGLTFETYTTSEARFLGPEVVIIWVHNECGCRSLRTVKAI